MNGSIPARVLLAAAALAAGCTDPLSETAVPVEIAVAATVVADGATDAYMKTDAVRITVTTSIGEVMADETMPFAPSTGSATRAQIRLDGEAAGQNVRVDVELLASGARVFDGSTTATPTRGSPATVEVDLRPIVAAVDAPAEAGPITAIGGTLQLDATPVFATGDDVPGAPLTWSALDPGIVIVGPTGLAEAKSEGVGRVEVRSGTVAAVIDVRVQAAVARVDVSPPSATIPIGGRLEFTAVPRDANGNALGGRTATWGSSNTNVLSVNAASGLATGQAAGPATLTATVEGVPGTAQVTVIQNIPSTPSNMSGSATGTSVAIGWTDNADNETRYEVLRAQGPPAGADGTFAGPPVVIAQLPANATSYQDQTGILDERFEYSVQACNDTGCSNPSNITVVVTVPTPPSDPRWDVINDRWFLFWADNSQYEGYFQLERRYLLVTVPGAWSPYVQSPANQPFYDFGFGGPEYGYEIRIFACNQAGCSAPSKSIDTFMFGEPPAGGGNGGGMP